MKAKEGRAIIETQTIDRLGIDAQLSLYEEKGK